jgi:hypothetical protein
MTFCRHKTGAPPLLYGLTIFEMEAGQGLLLTLLPAVSAGVAILIAVILTAKPAAGMPRTPESHN